MATITARKTKSGEARYRVTIRIKKDGAIVHQEVKTFGSKAVAKEWAKRRESELELPGAIEAQKHKGVTLLKVLETLHEETGHRFGRSRNSVIKLLMGEDIAQREIMSLTSADFISHCQGRIKRGTGGATVLQDVFYLKSAIKYARAKMAMPITTLALDEAAEWLRDNRVIHKPKRRSRLPSYDELARLDGYFRMTYAKRRTQAPMHLVMWLAIYSCRRQEEICGLLRSDIDFEGSEYIVRDMKSPNGSEGNHRTATMPEKGWEVLKELMRMAKSGEGGELLPVTPSAISSAFTKACKVLVIEDLHFHDLRHEGASRLAEDGYTVPQLQQVTLHDSWASLQIYVNMVGKKRKRLDYAAAP